MELNQTIARVTDRLIERSARDQLGGEASVDFLPHGVVYTVISSLETGD